MIIYMDITPHQKQALVFYLHSSTSHAFQDGNPEIVWPNYVTPKVRKLYDGDGLAQEWHRRNFSTLNVVLLLPSYPIDPCNGKITLNLAFLEAFCNLVVGYFLICVPLIVLKAVTVFSYVKKMRSTSSIYFLF